MRLEVLNNPGRARSVHDPRTIRARSVHDPRTIRARSVHDPRTIRTRSEHVPYLMGYHERSHAITQIKLDRHERSHANPACDPASFCSAALSIACGGIDCTGSKIGWDSNTFMQSSKACRCFAFTVCTEAAIACHDAMRRGSRISRESVGLG